MARLPRQKSKHHSRSHVWPTQKHSQMPRLWKHISHLRPIPYSFASDHETRAFPRRSRAIQFGKERNRRRFKRWRWQSRVIRIHLQYQFQRQNDSRWPQTKNSAAGQHNRRKTNRAGELTPYSQQMGRSYRRIRWWRFDWQYWSGRHNENMFYRNACWAPRWRWQSDWTQFFKIDVKQEGSVFTARDNSKCASKIPNLQHKQYYLGNEKGNLWEDKACFSTAWWRIRWRMD